LKTYKIQIEKNQQYTTVYINARDRAEAEKLAKANYSGYRIAVITEE